MRRKLCDLRILQSLGVKTLYHPRFVGLLFVNKVKAMLWVGPEVVGFAQIVWKYDVRGHAVFVLHSSIIADSKGGVEDRPT